MLLGRAEGWLAFIKARKNVRHAGKAGKHRDTGSAAIFGFSTGSEIGDPIFGITYGIGVSVPSNQNRYEFQEILEIISTNLYTFDWLPLISCCEYRRC